MTTRAWLLTIAAGVALAAGSLSPARATEVEFNPRNTGQWVRTLPTPFEVQEVTGSVALGLMAYGGNGRQVTYLLKLDPSSGVRWVVLPDAPFPIEGIAGTSRAGAFVAGGNRVAWLRDFRNPSWQEFPRAPFPIGFLGGDEGGPMAVSRDGSRMAALPIHSPPAWVEMPNPPFAATGGVAAKHYYYGTVMAGGRKLARIQSNKGRYVGAWEVLADAPFAVRRITGDMKYGLGILGTNGELAFTPRLNTGWTRLPAPTIQVEGMTGQNGGGLVVWGRGSAPTPPPPPPPPAPVDRAAPVVQIVNVQVNTDARATALDVTVQVRDDSPIASVTVNGRAATQGQGGSWTARVRVRGARNQVIAEATDVHGNTGRATQTVAVDTSPPSVQFVNVTAGRVCRQASFEVVVRVADDSAIAAVSVNGAPATLRAGSDWVATLRLQPGMNQLTAQAIDASGNTGSASVQLEADWQPPVVQASAQVLVTVSGRVDDPNSTVTIDGRPVQLRRDGSFTAQVAAGGARFVTVVARDRAGNESTQQIPVQ